MQILDRLTSFGRLSRLARVMFTISNEQDRAQWEREADELDAAMLANCARTTFGGILTFLLRHAYYSVSRMEAKMPREVTLQDDVQQAEHTMHQMIARNVRAN